jgi:hypothetical protein
MTVTAFYVPVGDLPSFRLFRCLMIRQIGQLRHRGPHVCPPNSIRFETSQCHENQFVTTWISLYLPSIIEAANPRNIALSDGRSSWLASNSSTRTAVARGPAPKASAARTRLAAGAVDIRQKANIILR